MNLIHFIIGDNLILQIFGFQVTLTMLGFHVTTIFLVVQVTLVLGQTGTLLHSRTFHFVLNEKLSI